MKNGKNPVVKDFDKVQADVRTFLTRVRTPEILNAGGICDSLMHENGREPFSEFIIGLLKEYDNNKNHRVLFLSKSNNVKNLLKIDGRDSAIMSFSLNAVPVAKRWEKAPSVRGRIKAAKGVFDAGYETRIRIDPMIPIAGWEKSYIDLADMIFDRFEPEMITLGSLRGLQSTIKHSADTTWVGYLSENSGWGKKIDLSLRLEMYKTIVDYLEKVYGFTKIALCKETLEVWKALGMDYRKIKCNCVW